MIAIFKYIVVLVFAVAFVSLASLLWPRFSTSYEPQVLQAVRSYVLNTQIGQNAAQVLGVSNEQNTEPLDASILVPTLTQSVLSAVQDKTSRIVLDQVVLQLSRSFEKLEPEQQEELKTIICKP